VEKILGNSESQEEFWVMEKIRLILA
jgi:hypothetical protein